MHRESTTSSALIITSSFQEQQPMPPQPASFPPRPVSTLAWGVV
jgi:hypothetical protein